MTKDIYSSEQSTQVQEMSPLTFRDEATKRDRSHFSTVTWGELCRGRVVKDINNLVERQQNEDIGESTGFYRHRCTAEGLESKPGEKEYNMNQN